MGEGELTVNIIKKVTSKAKEFKRLPVIKVKQDNISKADKHEAAFGLICKMRSFLGSFENKTIEPLKMIIDNETGEYHIYIGYEHNMRHYRHKSYIQCIEYASTHESIRKADEIRKLEGIHTII